MKTIAAFPSTFDTIACVALVAVVAASADGCGSSHSNASNAGDTDAGDDASVAPDDAGASVDATDAYASFLDGVATRQVCTNNFGGALSTAHGRLDGYLVSIVPITTHSCNGDSTHVHLQVMMQSAVYDVAVNIDGQTYALDHALPSPGWSEGFHAGLALDYPTDFGVHSTSFATTSTTAFVDALGAANHIAVYGTGYGPDGMHLIHRNGTKQDGAVIIDPLGPTPHIFAFDFTQDTF